MLSNNWEHTGFNFQTMTPSDCAWDEPDMAIGIAWLEYMAYVQFHEYQLSRRRRHLHGPDEQPDRQSVLRSARVLTARRWPPA